jgi:hypothetical protein
MNDDELITAVKESVTGVRMNIPAEQIVSRSRAIRTRRRIPVLAGALAVAAGAGLAVTTLLPASHQPSHPASAQLAAWTVTKQADGNIRVTVRELRDPAGLQRTLRADGVPASVTFTGQPNPACHGYHGGGDRNQRWQLLKSVYTPLPGDNEVKVVVIHPSALPSGAGVMIAAGSPHNQAPHGDSIELTLGLVQASPHCTGS